MTMSRADGGAWWVLAWAVVLAAALVPSVGARCCTGGDSRCPLDPEPRNELFEKSAKHCTGTDGRACEWNWDAMVCRKQACSDDEYVPWKADTCLPKVYCGKGEKFVPKT